MDHHSTNSKHSTPRYRAVSANSEVDESLFGRSNSGTLKNTGRRIVTGPVAPNAVVISQHELDRLKVRSIHPPLRDFYLTILSSFRSSL